MRQTLHESNTKLLPLLGILVSAFSIVSCTKKSDGPEQATVVRVENLVNKQDVEVRINDRGPFVHDRIIDLSHAAAQAISMPGIANVRLEVISTPHRRAVEVFAVQIGAFSQRSEAAELRAQMERKYGTATVIFRDCDQTWRVLVGHESTLGSANALASQLDKEAAPALVVLIDSGE